MSENLIYIINQFGNPARCTKDTWLAVQQTQPNAQEITAEEFAKLTGEEVAETPTDVEVVETPEEEGEIENITTEKEVKATIDLSAYTKEQLIEVLQALNSETPLTAKNTEAKIIAAIMAFDGKEITAVLPQ